MKTFSEARKMYDGGRAAKTGWNCGDCGAEKNRSDQCRSCGSPARHHRNDPVKNPHLQKEDLKKDFQKAAEAGNELRKFVKKKQKAVKEDLASGRPIKKPVSSSLLKRRAQENEKALKSGFMKLTPAERAKESKRFLEDTKWPRPFSKSERDEFLKKKKEPSAYRFPDKDGKAKALYRKEENINELVSGFRKGSETVSKKGTLHKSPHIAPDRDGDKVADALSKHDRLKTIKKAHKKLQKEGYKEDFKRQEMEHELGHETQGIKTQIKRGLKNFRNSSTAKQIRKKKTTYGVVAKEAFPDLEEGKKPVVHFKGEDKLKTLKIKLNPKKKIGVKVTDIGPGGKEVVRKNTMDEEQQRIVESLKSRYFDRDPESNSFNRTKSKETTVRVGQKRDKKSGKMVDVMGKTTAPQGLPGKSQKKR